MERKVQIFKITGVCGYEGEEDEVPCNCFPHVCVDCLIDNCDYFIMYEGEIDPDNFIE